MRDAQPTGSSGTTIIQPGTTRLLPDLRELWRYRELLRALVERDIKVRYKQTSLGVIWAILQPFVAMVVFTIVLNKAVGIPSEPGIPYPIYTYSGLIIWQYFAEGLARASRSLVTNNMLVTKVYFPRLTAPVSGLVSPLLDLLFAFVILIGMMFWYDINVSWTIVLVLPLAVATMITAAAFGIGLAALNVEFRDVGQAVPVALQFWMFLTPVFYAASSISGPLKVFEWLNPMASILAAFRWSLIDLGGPSLWPTVTSGLATVIVLALALRYFENVQRTFADSI